MPIAIFPCDPMHTRKIDPEYTDEYNYLKHCGVVTALWNMDDPEKAPYAIASDLTEKPFVFWRGWMLSTDQHGMLEKHIDAMGWMHTFEQQRQVHDCRGWSGMMDHAFPKERCFESRNCTANMWHDITEYCGTPVFVKSFVKSSGLVKACFTRDDVNAQLETIFRMRPDDVGFVARTWLDLASDQREVRVFCLGGTILVDDTDTAWLNTHRSMVEHISSKLPSNSWLSLDFAMDRRGVWWLMEIGDACVTGWKYYTDASQKRVLHQMSLISVNMETSLRVDLCP